jgi:hypothetical protein
VLSNRFGYLAYLLLRNDIGWRLLSDEERQIVIEANKNDKVHRQDRPFWQYHKSEVQTKQPADNRCDIFNAQSNYFLKKVDSITNKKFQKFKKI